MRNIVFDIGNTFSKYAVFNNGEIVCSGFVKEGFLSFIDNNIDGVLFSIVGGRCIDCIDEIKRKVKYCFVANSDLLVPLESLYETKETLGFDRIAVCVGANLLYPNSDILVIDAGTAITYDVVSKNAKYLGGLISLGINMRFRALSEFTAKLPLCEKSDHIPFIGRTTRESITGGVQLGIVNEIDAYINEIKIKFPNVKVFLTGGDANFFEKRLKNGIFVHQKLLVSGLNRILEYNAEKN